MLNRAVCKSMNVEDIKNRSNKIMEQLYRLFVHLLGFTDFLRL